MLLSIINLHPVILFQLFSFFLALTMKSSVNHLRYVNRIHMNIKDKETDNIRVFNKGYVYCLSNPSFRENIYKIGCTGKDPMIRMKSLYMTGVPTPFKIEVAQKVDNYKEVEKKLHEHFSNFGCERINKKREFFFVPYGVEYIRSVFGLVDGEVYKE